MFDLCSNFHIEQLYSQNRNEHKQTERKQNDKNIHKNNERQDMDDERKNRQTFKHNKETNESGINIVN